MSNRAHQQGLTLMELVVTCAIGGIVTLALMLILTNSRRSERVTDAKNKAVTESYVAMLGLETVFRQSMLGIAGFNLVSDASLNLFRSNATGTRSKYSLTTQCQPIPRTAPRYLAIQGRTFQKPNGCSLVCPPGQQYVISERRWPSWTADADPSTTRIYPSGNASDDPVGMAICYNSPAALTDAIGGRLHAFYLSAADDIVSVEKPFFYWRKQTRASIEVIP